MDLNLLQQTLREFAAQRDWQRDKARLMRDKG